MASKKPKESPPILHSAIPGQGLYSIGDASGNRRWIGAGREVNGWKVGDYDKKSNTLMVSKGDRKEYLQMGSGSVGEYTPPVATPDSQMIVGGGSSSDNEMILRKMVGPTMEEYNHIGFQAGDMDAMNRLKQSIQKSIQTATPIPEESEPLKKYQKVDENGEIQTHFYRGDLPDDAMRYGDQ